MCDVSLGQVGLEDLEHAKKLWVEAGFACNDRAGSDSMVLAEEDGTWCLTAETVRHVDRVVHLFGRSARVAAFGFGSGIRLNGSKCSEHWERRREDRRETPTHHKKF